jgi:hypothetical protein
MGIILALTYEDPFSFVVGHKSTSVLGYEELISQSFTSTFTVYVLLPQLWHHFHLSISIIITQVWINVFTGMSVIHLTNARTKLLSN